MCRLEPPRGGKPYSFAVTGTIQQGDRLPTIVDVQFPFESSPRRSHNQLLRLEPFYIDRYLVTNEEYRRFLEESGWKPPADSTNWLRSWTDVDDSYKYPEGWAAKPVQWVSRDDADAFCQYYNKRLPHSWEWQYAGQVLVMASTLLERLSEWQGAGSRREQMLYMHILTVTKITQISYSNRSDRIKQRQKTAVCMCVCVCAKGG